MLPARVFATTVAVLCLAVPARAEDNRPPAEPGRRVPFATGRVVGSPEPPPPYRLVRALPRLAFKDPLHLANEPDSDRLLVLEQYGKVWAVAKAPETDSRDLFLDVGRQLYGLAFHPRYAENGFVYVFSNTVKEKAPRNILSRFTVGKGTPRRCDPASELEILAWESNGHDGGEVAFGPRDGLLYASAGDSTSSSDPKETGQDLSDLLSAMIRIDVDHPSPGKAYSTPPDNPFIQLVGARPEIWAYGFRNPWRFCFDQADGRLWMGDIGQDLWEMIELVERGSNHGWSVKEGPADFLPRRPKRGPTPIRPPVVAHHHSEARSITGGFVYRADRFPDLKGRYVYGDFATGRLWAFRYDDGRVEDHREIADSTVAMLGFCVDRHGEVFTPDFYSGEIYRLEVQPPRPAPPTPFPRRLSETGLFASARDHRASPGVIPYDVNSPLWSDGAGKLRSIAVPGLARVGFKPTIDDPWALPEGTVLVKTFTLPTADSRGVDRRVETRLMVLRDKEWAGYTYLWDDDQADAVLVGKGGLDRPYTVLDPKAPGGTRAQSWHYPSRAECMVCHSRAAGFVLGLTTGQMNRDLDYGRGPVNQILALADLGLFEVPPSKPPGDLPRLANPHDPSAPLDARARAYLNTNCAICHVENGGGNAQMQLKVSLPEDELSLFDRTPQHHGFGLDDPKLVAPGRPDRSVLLRRVATRGEGRMPPLASSVVDDRAVELLRAWIAARPPAAKPTPAASGTD